MSGFEAAVARARGLRARLLAADEFAHLRTLGRLPALAAALADTGRLRPSRPAGPGPAALEAALRREASARLARLALWLDGRAPLFAVELDGEERRSLRALVRGAAAGTAPERRLSALVPTPALPARALEALARLASPRDLAGALLALGHPYAAAVARGVETDPDRPLLSIEREIDRTWAGRAVTLARAGGRETEDWARESIDVANALGALAWAGRGGEDEVAAFFLAGGRRLDAGRFAQAARAGSPAAAAAVLAPAFAGTPLRAALAAPPGAVERAVLAARLAVLDRCARLDPLGPAPILAFLLAQRAEMMDLSRLIWGLALGAPPGRLAPLACAA